MAAQSLRYSRAELTALLLKAGRGAGIPLAHAEDLARAVGRHGHGAAFAEALAALNIPWTDIKWETGRGWLRIRNAHSIQALPHMVEALRGGGYRSVIIEGLDHPALVPCYLAGEKIDGHPPKAPEEGPLSWRFTKGGPSKIITRSSVRMDDQSGIAPHVIAGLEALAARTYVPASDTSRGGAGQGADQD
ncbi:MAG: hypothetical protein AAF227_05350 [Pseudomonadota bacterium]